MFRLNDPLITSFEFDGEEHPIDLAFDAVLDVFDVLEDDNLRSYEKAEICLFLLLEKEFEGEQAVELWNHIYENYIHVEEETPIKLDLNGNPMPVQDEERKKPLDIEQDAKYIYASFQQAYNINLYQEQGELHWLEFKALLNGLPSDTIMQRIIQIRLWEPRKGDSSEYKQSMREMQKLYALDGEEVD